MSFLGGTASGTDVAASQETRKLQLMDQLRSEMALANAQALIEKINDKCFLKCITKPSSTLTSWEQNCLGNCMDRYMEAFNVVSKTYVSRLAEESQNRNATGSTL